jgi:hypothetical protein
LNGHTLLRRLIADNGANDFYLESLRILLKKGQTFWVRLDTNKSNVLGADFRRNESRRIANIRADVDNQELVFPLRFEELQERWQLGVIKGFDGHFLGQNVVGRQQQAYAMHGLPSCASSLVVLVRVGGGKSGFHVLHLKRQIFRSEDLLLEEDVSEGDDPAFIVRELANQFAAERLDAPTFLFGIDDLVEIKNVGQCVTTLLPRLELMLDALDWACRLPAKLGRKA